MKTKRIVVIFVIPFYPHPYNWKVGLGLVILHNIRQNQLDNYAPFKSSPLDNSIIQQTVEKANSGQHQLLKDLLDEISIKETRLYDTIIAIGQMSQKFQVFHQKLMV